VGQEIIRRIYRPVVEHGMWRVRTDQELGELCKDLDIVADINRKRFEWMGHVARTDQGRTVKEIFESKAGGKQKKGKT